MARTLPFGEAQNEAVATDHGSDRAGRLPAVSTGRMLSRMLVTQAVLSWFAVLLVASTNGEAIEAYSSRVAREWQIGKPGFGNGLLIVVASEEIPSPAGVNSGEPFVSIADGTVLMSWLERNGEGHDLRFSRFDAEDELIASYDSLYIIEPVDGRWGVRARSSFAP